MTTELITQELTPKDVFKPNGLDIVIAGVKEKKEKFQAETNGLDLTVKKNRDTIKSFAHAIARSKTFVDGKGKDFVAQIKVQAKEVDAERKRFRDLMDTWRDEVKTPVVEWEKAEEERKDHIKGLIKQIEESYVFEYHHGEITSEKIQARLDFIDSLNISEEFYQEYLEYAMDCFIVAKDTLESMLLATKKQEEERAELERLRKAEAERQAKEEAERQAKEKAEREERIRREAAEQAAAEEKRRAEAYAAEAERKIREECEAREWAEHEAKAAAERAEREKLEAIENAKREAQEEADRKERERLAREQAEKEKAERKAANKRHQASINNKIKAALCEIGVDEDLAKKIIVEAAQRRIPCLRIEY